MEAEQKEVEERLKSELFSSEEPKVLGALKKIGEEGSRNMVSPLLELLVHSSSETVHKVILTQLSELKISEVENLFIEKLQQEEYSPFSQALISCMWNSGLNPTDHMHVLSKLACEKDYMTSLEVLTLLENMEGPFDHDSLTEAFSDVSVYVNEASPEDPKLDLIKSIYGILYAFQEEN